MTMWPFSQRKGAAEQTPAPEVQNTSLENPSNDLTFALTGGFESASIAGPVVNEQTAIRSTTVYRCVSLISGLGASIPLSVYERTEDGRRTAIDNRLYPILHDVPNDLMGSFTWRELMFVDLLLGGNHYSAIERDNANRPVGLMPIARTACEP